MDKDLVTTKSYAVVSNTVLDAIKKTHKEVSAKETPKNEMKKDYGGFDYVEMSYMKRVADEFFPGWSWTIIDRMVHPVGQLEIAFSIHGRLTWYDNGVVRTGDMTAGHANHLLKDKTGYVSVSNAWKSANTECMKKAFNVFMNIADDVYKNLDTSLDQTERTTLLNLLSKIDKDWLLEEQGTTKQEMDEKILNGTINKASLNLSTQKIEKWIRLCEADLADGWKAPK
ncbi:MAG: hypothetical protein HOG49_05590 [Candidatus Scalindua sp.]|mgnify:CR=1 FL=1|jgi:hypothetical protein|nr:hypothetical protein [Candidatus Scalindua sp.]